MTLKQKFYDSYHKKNKHFYKIIKKNNFTYYKILRFFHREIAHKLSATAKFSNKIIDLSKVQILDIGCGVGSMALYFGSLGASVKGIDISQRAIDISNAARKQLGIKNVSFVKKFLQRGNEKYNMVIVSEVIEHIEDEKDFLGKISTQLKTGGLLYLTTPLKENLLYKLGFYKKFDTEVGHLRRYTEKSIVNLLQRNGFQVLKSKRVEGPLRNLLFTTRFGFLIRFIRGPLVSIFHWLDSLSIKLFGATDILVLAKKK